MSKASDWAMVLLFQPKFSDNAFYTIKLVLHVIGCCSYTEFSYIANELYRTTDYCNQ